VEVENLLLSARGNSNGIYLRAKGKKRGKGTSAGGRRGLRVDNRRARSKERIKALYAARKILSLISPHFKKKGEGKKKDHEGIE